MSVSSSPLILSSSSSPPLHFLPSSSPPLHFPPSSDPPYKLLETHPSLSLLSTCKTPQTLKQIHSHFIKFGLHNTHFALTKLLQFCAISPSRDLPYALLIFDSIENPNHVAYNIVIRGFSLSSTPVLGIRYYVDMLCSGLEPNSYTFPFLFKMGGREIGRQIHGHVIKFGLQDDLFVHTSIVHMYSKNGEVDSARLAFEKRGSRDAVSFTALIKGYVSGGRFDDARKLFDEIPVKDVVSWNALISGYAQMGRFDDSLGFFEEMRREGVSPDVSTLLSVLSACAHVGALDMGDWVRTWIQEHGLGSNLRLTNALIDMYAKCGDLITARMMFDGINERDLISWNVMIGGYTHSSKFKEALDVFHLMQMENVKPNDVTFLSVLPACAHLGALALGKWIHAYIDKHRDNFTNPALSTSLISFYAKCGNIAAAKQVFDGIDSVTLGSWNVMISGLAMHGDAQEALELFSKMVDKGFTPDGITFISILSACSHAGLVDVGRQWFNTMVQEYNISPKLQHYGCMIDLLGRAGLFDEAMALIENMDVEPDGAIWGSLLGACRIHGNLELGKTVSEKLFKLEPNNPGAYVLLSNIYAQAGRWDEVARIRTMLNDMGMKKLPGCTSIEVDSVVHEFLVSDKTHPQSEDIYKMLDEMSRLLEMAGHVPDTSEVFYDIEEKWKEGVVCQHSEMLAISYGLISTKPGTTLRIVKNLRVCNNCHTATKLISNIFKREIIARDRNRFHHFKDGSCSCMDYW